MLSKDKIRGAGVPALNNNMLRSEHIPYNLFSPLETVPDISTKIFEEIIDIPIDRILGIEIEHAGMDDKELYLHDRTSFDTFVWYETPDGKKGGLGIEVKYIQKMSQ